MYLNYKAIKIKKNISELLSLNDALDTDLCEALLIIDDILSRFSYFENITPADVDLSYRAHSIYDLKVACDIAIKTMLLKYGKYYNESNKRFKVHGV